MTRDARRIVGTRALRGLADGLVSVLLAEHLMRLGLDAVEVGAIVTGTLIGSAALTMAVGLRGHGLRRRAVLLAASLLMVGTGAGFATFRTFWPLLAVAVVGTLNPSAGDVSVFLPTEQAALAETAHGVRRTTVFAWYNVGGTLAGAAGALASGAPAAVAGLLGADVGTLERATFGLYAAVGAVAWLAYRRLSPAVEHRGETAARPLARSRRVVLELAALFSLDSFGGGFVVQSLLVLWLVQRFALSTATLSVVFFAAGLVGAASQLLSARVAARIGLVRAMVYTHLPANLFLVAAGIVPSARAAIALLLARAALSQMDVPARQAYVMAVVPPEERAAAASVTNVPRSLAAALAPLLTGMLLARSSFGWPLVVAGTLKAVYDLVLFVRFSAVSPPDA